MILLWCVLFALVTVDVMTIGAAVLVVGRLHARVAELEHEETLSQEFTQYDRAVWERAVRAAIGNAN